MEEDSYDSMDSDQKIALQNEGSDEDFEKEKI
jgi:hypothetical protein